MEKIIFEKVGIRLKQARELRHITLEEAGKKVDVHKSTVLRWENGETEKIKFPVIEVLASFYNVNPVWLMGYDVPMERDLKEKTDVKDNDIRYTKYDGINMVDKLNILMNRKNIKNLSQLSRETNIPYTTLKSIFDGDVNDIRLSTSRKICDYFGITLDDLLDDDIEINDVRYAEYNGLNTEGLTDEDIKEIEAYIEMRRNINKNKNKQ